MFFHQRFVPGLAIYSYMFGDEKSKQCAVIDPTRDVDEYLETARREGLRIPHVRETHVHADFVSGSAELKDRLGDEVQVVFSGMGGAEWTPPHADRVVGNGDEIALGTVRLKAVHTPGHTYEHVSWARFDDTRSEETPWLVFTGDFVFVGDVGRPDLLGEEARRRLAHQLYESVFGVLPGLPDFTEVFPAHGAGSPCGKAIGSRSSSTLGHERRFNGALQGRDEPEWVATLLKGMPIAPPYFRRMKRVNAEGPRVLTHLLRVGFDEVQGYLEGGLAEWETHGYELGRLDTASVHDLAARLKDRGSRPFVLDVRTDSEWEAGHVEGAHHIHGGTLEDRYGEVPRDRPVAVVCGTGYRASIASSFLKREGYGDVADVLGGMAAWKAAGLPTAKG